MIINRINTNNNFGAQIVGKLAEEMINKREGYYPQHISLDNTKLSDKITLANRKEAKENAENLEDALDTIQLLAGKAKVDITENGLFYKISIGDKNTYYTRGNDKTSYKYPNLIKKLSEIHRGK